MLPVLLVVVPAAVRLTRAQVLGGCIAAVPVALEVYARAPPSWQRADLPKIQDSQGAEELVVVLHGAGGPDANTNRIADSLRSSNKQVFEYVFERFVGDQLQAPYNCMRIGDFLAEELRREATPPCRVHIVGVSVGAFAADRLASRLAADRRFAHIRLTLLDPFTARGIPGLLRPDSAFGVTSFGSSPRVFTESVFNRDDPVPSTNLPLHHAINFDVTETAARRSFVPLPGDSLHSWPAAWFGSNPGALERLGARNLPKGSVTLVP